MTQQVIDVRAQLSAEDKASDPIRRLMRQIKDLENKIKSANSRGTLTPTVWGADDIRKLTSGGKILNGLTKTHLDWAKGVKNANRMTADSWRDLQKDMFDAATKMRSADSKSEYKAWRRKAALLAKREQAYAHVWNQYGGDRVKDQERNNRLLGELDDAYDRRKTRLLEKGEADRHRSRQRWGRRIMQAGRVPGYAHQAVQQHFARPARNAAVVAGGAAAAASASSIRTRMKIDQAETDARIFGELSVEDIAKMRKGFGNSASIKYGVGVADTLKTYTEAAKAGISKDQLQPITDLILAGKTGVDLNLEETTKLIGTLYSIDKTMTVDKARSALSMVGIAAKESRADSNEIVAANRRSMGVMKTSKMSFADMSALNAIGVSSGLQGAKAGTFLDFLVNELVGAMHNKGERGKQLGAASKSLGMGDRKAFSTRFAANPADVIIEIFEKMEKMTEAQRSKVANQLGMREWRGEITTVLSGLQKLKDVRAAQKDPKNANYINDASDLKRLNLTGRWKSMVSAFEQVWEAVGKGFDRIFIAFTDFATKYLTDTNLSALTDIVDNFVSGLAVGFGFKDWGDLFASIFGDQSNMADMAANFFNFAKGFAEGLTSIWNAVKSVFTGIAEFFNVDTSKHEDLGKFVGQLVGLAAALAILAPVIGAFTALVTGISAIVSSVVILGTAGSAAILALAAALGIVGLAATDIYKSTPEGMKKLKTDRNKRIDDREKRNEERRKNFWGGSEGSEEKPVKKMSLTQSVDDLNETLEKFGAKIERASLVSGGITDFSAAKRVGAASAEAAAVGSSPSVSGGLAGTVAGQMMSSTQGGKLNLGGLGPGGSFSPGGGGGGLNAGAFDKMFAGTPLAGQSDAIVAAAKKHGVEPALLAGIMAHETGKGKNVSGNNPGGIMDPATNWATKKKFGSLSEGIDYTAKNLAKRVGETGGDLGALANRYAPQGAANDPSGLNKNWPGAVSNYRNQLSDGSSSGVGSAGSGGAAALKVAEQYKGLNEYNDTSKLAGFMGGRDPRGAANAWCAAFVNSSLKAVGGKGTGSAVANSFQKWGQAVNDHAQVAAGDVMVETKGRGAGETGGHVGFATGKTRMGKGGLEMEMFGGNQSDAAGYKWTKSNGNLMVRRGVPGQNVPGVTGNVPATANVPQKNIQNVPPAGTSSGITPGMTNASYGGSTIHINGSSHDPEALANLVQRRIDEQHNYRLHDVDAGMA